VNLFAAGSNFAPAVATGTGFFLGRRGNVFTVFSETPLREFYVMRVPKDPAVTSPEKEDIPEPIESSFGTLSFGRDLINEFKTELIDFFDEGLETETEFCYDDHCCIFRIDYEKLESNTTFQYRYVAFNDYRTYSGWGSKKLVICAIMICNDETLDSCGRMPNYELDQVKFNFIEISTTFNRLGVLMMPNSLDLTMNPLSIDQFSYDEFVTSATSRTSTITLLQPYSDLQAFALYGHDYGNDEEFDFDGSGLEEGSGDD
jgi:Vanin C-terminal domain